MNRTLLRYAHRIVGADAVKGTKMMAATTNVVGNILCCEGRRITPRGYRVRQRLISSFQQLQQRSTNRQKRNRRFSSSIIQATGDAIKVTRTSKASLDSSLPYDLEKEELTAFVDDLFLRTRFLMDKNSKNSNNNENNESSIDNTILERTNSAHHVIAFSGGIDSSVAAALVHGVAVSTSSSSSSLSSRVYTDETVTAVLGLSPAVPMDQRELAEEVASAIGVTLEQVSTTEGTDDVYVANDGRACLACKTHLYDNLKSIAEHYNYSTRKSSSNDAIIMYNGTNADDLNDPTRLGLIAASDFGVRSPLSGLPKDRVRAVGRHLGLPNWDHAASPCLRSRLAVGVEATSGRLKDVGASEAFVRNALGKDQPGGVWDVRRSLRVRILSKNRAMIEVDDDQLLRAVQCHLQEQNENKKRTTTPWRDYFENELGFADVGVRKFKTGSVAPLPPVASANANPNRIATIASPTGSAPRKLRRRP